MSSLEILCNMTEGKCQTEKITKKVNCLMKTFYLPEILVLDVQVTKTSDKPAKNSQITKSKGFQQFSVRRKK